MYSGEVKKTTIKNNMLTSIHNDHGWTVYGTHGYDFGVLNTILCFQAWNITFYTVGSEP